MSAPKVLLVDDEPNMRWTMSEFLRRGGYEPLTAADVESATDILRGEQVDAAVVDIVLPGRSGVELLREIHGREPYVPVIMITGEPNSALVPEIVRAGAYDYIAKPIRKDALLKTVAGAVERKRLLDEKRRLEDEIRRHNEELEARVAERTAELVRAHERLARQEKIAALGRAAAQVAHEVKNPLAGLLLYAMHLKGKVADKLSESELVLVDKIVETINHLTGTVEQVLDHARPVTIRPRPTDLNRVVRDMLQLVRPQITGALIEERLELDERGCRGMLDETALRCALMNLVLNAVQAMPGGGTLTVRTRDEGTTLRVEVADTGRGMDDDEARQVFEPFYTTKSQGLGLGMPYAQKVIAEHRGSIAVESTPGAGTTIRVELPAATDAG